MLALLNYTVKLAPGGGQYARLRNHNPKADLAGDYWTLTALSSIRRKQTVDSVMLVRPESDRGISQYHGKGRSYCKQKMGLHVPSVDLVRFLQSCEYIESTSPIALGISQDQSSVT